MNEQQRKRYFESRALGASPANALHFAKLAPSTSYFSGRLWSDTWQDVELGAGHTLRAKLEYDEGHEAPWIEYHCLAKPESLGRRYRASYDERLVDGELSGHVRMDTRHETFYYPFADALARARAEQREYAGKIGRAEIESRAISTVQSERKFFARYLREDWAYVGVVVELVNDDEDVIASESLWGIESDADEHLTETANDLAREVLADSNFRFARASTLETA